MNENTNSIKDVYVKQIAHGFNKGNLFLNMVPSITASSYECNNFIIVIYERQDE